MTRSNLVSRLATVAVAASLALLPGCLKLNQSVVVGKDGTGTATTKVVMVGYQAPGTLGRRLVEGQKKVRIRGQEVAVNASIHTLGGFSAHAGKHELLDWVRAIETKPKRVFMVHGEPRALEALGASIREEMGLDVTIPEQGQAFDL